MFFLFSILYDCFKVNYLMLWKMTFTLKEVKKNQHFIDTKIALWCWAIYLVVKA